MKGRLGSDCSGVMARLFPLLLLVVSLVLPATPALAVAPQDFPAAPPEGHVLDSADVLSRASTGELGSRLASLESDHITPIWSRSSVSTTTLISIRLLQSCSAVGTDLLTTVIC